MTGSVTGSAARDMPWSAVRPRWSPRRWLTTLAIGAAVATAFIVFSAPWWIGLILGACLPALVYSAEAQRNMEWFGYRRCPTCNGSGKVAEDA